MSDRFSTISLERLMKWADYEYKHKKEIFGISEGLFFRPSDSDPFSFQRYGQLLQTPLGVAAGPQTQMAQNIISAYLTGARYIELKTVQTLDELDVSKPCIDMEDEGYNCEWSQELKLDQSFDEYLNAWIMIPVINHLLGLPDKRDFIFNMSVGYNLEGILKENVQRFFSRMNDCKSEKEAKIEALAKDFPFVRDLDIPNRMSDNITLSTMHGCPPEEIESIGMYLIKEKKLNTTIKLNPTLLGAETLRGILNDILGYRTVVPDEAFEHDLKYNDMLSIVRNLKAAAEESGVDFGLKLTNTLESVNNRDVFPPNEKMMYMSGRALHPLSINLASRIQSDFNGELDVSFSAGADCFNIDRIIACGIKPVTVSSDLLKPGGYGRMSQYIAHLKMKVGDLGARHIDEYILLVNGNQQDVRLAALENLRDYAKETLEEPYYRKTRFSEMSIKTTRPLTDFDCVQAPCVTTCPANQSVPDYMRLTAKGKTDEAFKVIMKTNPFPAVTGMVCDHACMTKCTRLNYDLPLNIREIKRYVTEKEKGKIELKPQPFNGKKAAIIGAGPSGLSCAFFLALEGFKVTVYEAKGFAGGMVSDAIPAFRLTDDAIRQDIERIEKLGVVIHYNTTVDKKMFADLKSANDYLYIGVGAQSAKKMRVKGEDNPHVIDGLKFLSDVRRGLSPRLGKRVAIVGGGNSAMDAVRTALRLCDSSGEVAIVYRRTVAQMPADYEEIEEALAEGARMYDLTQPAGIVSDGDGVVMKCFRMELGEPDDSGRRRPVKVDGSDFEMRFDTIIPAIGQDIVVDFADEADILADNIYIGGDALNGPKNIITAVAQGHEAALSIIRQSGVHPARATETERDIDLPYYQKKSAYREYPVEPVSVDMDKRKGFDVVIQTYTDTAAKKEAERCLRCNDICNVCVTVCPNRANISYMINPVDYRLSKVYIENGKPRIEPDGNFTLSQKYQTANIADFCNECGNCAAFCPTSGAPYRDKPRICLTEESFSAETNAYFLLKTGGKLKIRSKSENGREELWIDEGGFIYEREELSAKFDIETFDIKILSVVEDLELSGEYRFERAARMSVLLNYLTETPMFAGIKS